jgi:hypothetical protein
MPFGRICPVAIPAESQYISAHSAVRLKGQMRLRMRRIVLSAAVVAAALAAIPWARLHGQVQDPPIPHDSGQSVSPSFEGWYTNADGTYSLSFGYFNRNFKEEPDIEVGANNKFSPGAEDRGQPTHFMTRRVFGAFAVVVPKEAAADKNFKLTWTITAHGQGINERERSPYPPI